MTVAVLGLGAVPATASSVSTFAAPNGTGSPPCAHSAPCSLEVAAAAASDASSDSVYLLKGEYALTSTLTTTAHLQTTGGRAHIRYEGPTHSPALVLMGSYSFVRGLSIEGTTADRVPLVTTGTSNSVELVASEVVQHDAGLALMLLGGGVVRDSTFVSKSHVATVAVQSGTVVGSTLVNRGTGPALEVGGLTVVRNSILQGSATGAVDVLVSAIPGQVPDIDYSALRPGSVFPTGSAALGSHNVAAPALLVDPSNGTDLHQLPGSPTIDAGLASVIGAGAFAHDLHDFEGDVRTYGSAPDIGADEAVPLPVAESPTVSDVTSTTATISSYVNPFGRQAMPRVEYGTSPSLGLVSGPFFESIADLVSARPVKIGLTNLTPGTTYHARMVTTWGFFDGRTTDMPFTFTTTAPPQFPPTPSIQQVRMLQRLVRVGQSPVLLFVANEPADLTLTVDRVVPGRQHGTACRPSARTGQRCVKLVPVASFRRAVASGNSARWLIPARIRGKLLRPGTYRVSLQGRTTAGQPVTPRRVTFVVQRPMPVK